MDPFLSTWLVSPVWSELVARILPAAPTLTVNWRERLAWQCPTEKETVEEDVRRLVHQLTLQVLDGEPGLRLLGSEGARISGALTITLMALDAVELDLVQESALDPDRLVEQMRLAAPEAAAALIDDRAHALYDVLLLGSCTHLVEHFTHPSEFQDRTFVEIRRQLAVLEERIAEADERSAAFEAAYREATTVAHADARLYVNLSVLLTGEDGNRPEDLFAAYPRMLVEGSAGAGKTTLLQRLALRVAENELPSQLDEWRDRGLMPFLLRLRRFVTRDGLRLPSPEEFVEVAAGKPENWVAEMLRQRRAIVLVDGVDEIPAPYRPKLMSWIESLILLYPDARFVLTSRPDALDTGQRERLARLGFATGRLESMTTNQVDDFIRRWHAITPAPVGGAEPAEQAGRLIGTLATRRDLARLATNPMLCAMLCALSRDGSLPRGRDALFEAALVRLLGPAEPGREILSDVAMRMTLDGRRTIERDALPPGVPEAVLRESTNELVEFRHPGFQDFLAASAVFQDHNLDHVIHNAGDPLYRDVIIMAAGQSHNDADRRDLLAGLTAQAEAAETPDQARVLWLLAAACVAGIEWVSPHHAELIKERTRRLLPPRTSEEARNLAKAGGFVFDLVADIAAHRHLTAEEAAATIEVAILAGGDDAIPLLGRFARHAAKEVRKALVNAWFGSRVPEKYANEVLAQCSLTDIVVVLPGSEYLPYLHRLRGLRHLDLTRVEIADLEPLASLSTLRHLYLASARNVKNVDLIRAEIPKLQIMS